MPYVVHHALGQVQISPDIWTNQEYPKIFPLAPGTTQEAFSIQAEVFQSP